MFELVIGGLGLVAGPLLAYLVEVSPDRSGGGHDARRCLRCDRSRPAATYLPLVGGLLRCGSCGRRRVADVAIVITAAVAFYSTAATVGARWALIPLLIFASALIVLGAIDILRYRLPDIVLAPAFALSLVALTAVSIGDDAQSHIVPALVGSAAYFVLLLIPNLVNPAGIAFGDVKLALLLGLVIGWMRPSTLDAFILVMYALLIGMALGVLSGLLVGVGRRVVGPGFLPDPDSEHPDEPVPVLRTAFPMGPGLALSALFVVLMSGTLLEGPGLF